jgi:hypothetical protein
MIQNDEIRVSDPVDDALATYPLTPAPERLRIRVMRSVRARPRLQPLGIPWLEGALGLLTATMLTVTAYLLVYLHPFQHTSLELYVRRALSGALFNPAAIGLIVGLGLLTLFVFLAAAIFTVPAFRHRSIQIKSR